MEIVCCLKAVPTEVNGLRVSSSGDGLEYTSRSVAINETDEYALEEAIYLRKKYGGQVTVVTAGPRATEEVLYKALAKGADRAFRVDLDSASSALTGMVLASAIKRRAQDLILAGMESSDNMAAYVGVSVAQRLGLPFALGVTRIEAGAKPGTLEVTRELGGGVQALLEITLPAVLCIQSGIQALTYAPVAKIFQVRRQRLDCFNLADFNPTGLDLELSRRFKFVDVAAPKAAGAAQILTGGNKELVSTIMERIQEVL